MNLGSTDIRGQRPATALGDYKGEKKEPQERSDDLCRPHPPIPPPHAQQDDEIDRGPRSPMVHPVQKGCKILCHLRGRGPQMPGVKKLDNESLMRQNRGLAA